LKPSGTRVPMYPASAAGALSCNGPLTRSVADSALLLGLVARPDPRDGVATLADGGDYALNDDLKGLKAASSATMGYAPLVDSEVAAVFQRAVKTFAGIGIEVEVEDPGIEDPIATYLTLLHANYQFSLRNIPTTDHDKLSPQTREILLETKPVTLPEYLQALEQCQVFARRFHMFHSRYDVLLTPTVAAPAFAAERTYPEEYERFANRRAWTPFTAIFNLTQQPAISVPIGLTSRGLPVGLQIVGARGNEMAILKAAAAFEKANGFARRPPLS